MCVNEAKLWVDLYIYAGGALFAFGLAGTIAGLALAWCLKQVWD